MTLHAVVSNGRTVPVETRKKRIMSARDVAESLFRKRGECAANANKPRVLEVVNDAPPAPVTGTSVSTVVETDHEKVFRLVGEKRFEEAARIAARLINAGDFEPFFIYPASATRRANDWFDAQVLSARRSALSTIHNVTPELAQVLLVNNEKNRRVKAKNLSDIMRDIVDDRFLLNGSSALAISREALLNDGQHRCWAGIFTGAAFKTVITFGVERSSMGTIDIGHKRTGGDRLQLRGKTEYIVAAAVANMLFEYENGRAPTASEVDAYFLDREDEIQAAIAARGSSTIKGLGPSISATAAALLMRLGAEPDAIKSFFKIIRTNELTKKGDAARAIHLGLFPLDRMEPPLKLPRSAFVALLMNHFREWNKGKKVKALLIGQPIPEAL